VYVSVRLSAREHIFRITRVIFTIFVHVAYGSGSVFLWLGNEILRERDNFWSLVYFPIDNALYSIAFGTPPYKSG